MKDLYLAYFMLALTAVGGVGYAVRSLLRGRAAHARTEADGGSVFLNKASMEMGYWMLAPIVTLMVTLRISPAAITLFSLVPSLIAGVALASGYFGLACMTATAAALADIVDGLVARRTGVASQAGELLDAIVDRYGELIFLGGLAIFFRSHLVGLLLVLIATLGTIMFSYTTAKAEAIGTPAPRGTMRRGERAVYLNVGAALTALSMSWFSDASHAVRTLPIAVALTLVGIATNVSTWQRVAAVRSALADKSGANHPMLTAVSAAGVSPHPPQGH